MSVGKCIFCNWFACIYHLQKQFTYRYTPIHGYVFYIDVRTHTQFAEKVELSEDCAAEF